RRTREADGDAGARAGPDGSRPGLRGRCDSMVENAKRTSPYLIAFTSMLGTLMEVVDTSVANVSLPHMQGREHVMGDLMGARGLAAPGRPSAGRGVGRVSPGPQRPYWFGPRSIF